MVSRQALAIAYVPERWSARLGRFTAKAAKESEFVVPAIDQREPKTGAWQDPILRRKGAEAALRASNFD